MRKVPNEVNKRCHLIDRCTGIGGTLPFVLVSWVVGYLIWMCVLVPGLTVTGLLQCAEVMT